jgi:S-adenosylmethionine:diacylglycerol 3-amino-3-carboxypropyl transferase
MRNSISGELYDMDGGNNLLHHIVRKGTKTVIVSINDAGVAGKALNMLNYLKRYIPKDPFDK